MPAEEYRSKTKDEIQEIRIQELKDERNSLKRSLKKQQDIANGLASDNRILKLKLKNDWLIETFKLIFSTLAVTGVSFIYMNEISIPFYIKVIMIAVGMIVYISMFFINTKE